MAEIKYQFDGIAKLTATLLFTAMATGPLSFLTTGILGRITFFVLKRFGNWIANQGLAIANIGVDFIVTASEKKNYDSAMEEALKKVMNTKRKLTKKEQDEIDEPVRKAFRKFASLV